MSDETTLALVAELRALREDLTGQLEEVQAMRADLDVLMLATPRVLAALERIARAVEAREASRTREMTLRPAQPKNQGGR